MQGIIRIQNGAHLCSFVFAIHRKPIDGVFAQKKPQKQELQIKKKMYSKDAV